jgi:hypothetical protein
MKFFESNKNLKEMWWLLLFLSGSYYVLDNYSDIVSSADLVDLIIITAYVIIIFLPLVSEISFMGMNIKKELEITKAEVKKDISDLKSQIMMMSINNAPNYEFHVNTSKAPTASEVEQRTHKNKNAESFEAGNDSVKEVEHSILNYSASADQKFLFSTRFTIERMISDICSRYDIPDQLALSAKITMLRGNKVIDTGLEDLLFKVLSICNRGIHGEIVDRQYIDYIKVVMIDIEDELNKALETKVDEGPKGFISCTRCGYSGASQYDNVCPRCGFVTDEW